MVKHTVMDSFELMGILNKIDMASFDFQSLFTNVPVREVMQIICDYVDKKQIRPSLLVSVPERLLLLCETDASLSFQGNAYRQIDDVAMASPLSPVLSDLFMANLEQKGANILEHAIL
ncbi:unnamed protein product [Echinostoma caproni]|uniref:Reverse transcriptase domain-containing protein n=1 Tax=Echinostoma caproni TaxID=27848 RepID=A0A183AZ31_9TREM|nr:unnamed protein product [Echinostoma caproni]